MLCLTLVSFVAAMMLGDVTPEETKSGWVLDTDGGITWNVQPGAAHQDQIEMSGRKVSLIASYGVDEKAGLFLRRQIVFPLLRTLPNDTHASLSYLFSEDTLPRVLLNGHNASDETVRSFSHKGIMSITSVLGNNHEVLLARRLFPSTKHQLVVERLTFLNSSSKPLRIEVERTERIATTNAANGFMAAT